MRNRIVRSLLAVIILGLAVSPDRAVAQVFRGVEFPQGAASFADAVVAYAPDLQYPLRSDVKNPGEALGPPDDVTGIPAEYVSLGNGGSLTLRFVDNALTGSGNANKDLWVFEIGPLVEDTTVAISRDAIVWTEVGTVAGSTSGVDIDPFVSDPAVKYSYVRLIDVATEDVDTGNTAGADIDAVGAISTVVRPADTTAPLVTVPAGLAAEATAPGGAAVEFAASANDIVDGPLTPTCLPAFGATFSLGTTTVACTATDDAGNTGSASFAVTVVDTTGPEIAVPADASAEATSVDGAVVGFEPATAVDLVDGALTPICDAEAGTTFPLGATTVTCTATDTRGNASSADFTITVEDTTPPTLTVPADFAVEATGPAGAAVAYESSALDVVDGVVVPACAPPSGGTFPLGTTAVDCTAADAAGNSASAGFAVAVADSTSPVVTVPAGVTVEATSPAGATVEFAASATDLVDGAPPIVCDAASGSTFPVGATTVTCGATDSAGNQGSASFVVTVVAPTYSICPLYDQSKAVKAGAVKAIRVQLCDAAGNNLSSPEIVVHAAGLVHIDGTPSALVEDAGNANPDHDFRYDAGAYVFNLDTDGLASGTWKLLFTVNGYATVYEVIFDVR